MEWLKALILGLVQGLTEFLPVSSSGHLEIGKVLLNMKLEHSLTFSVVVHGATVLSTIVVFHKDISNLFKGLFQFRWNEETIYISKLLLSFIPVAFVGFFMKDYVESFFSGDLLIVGVMLLVTSLLLTFSHYAKPRHKKITYLDSIIIGIAQAFAVMPGISRSGATISTGLLLGDKREATTRFSFLMVLIPIIGANVLDVMSWDLTQNKSSMDFIPLLAGFIAAFISGIFACKWMIKIVKKGKLIYFAVYTAIIGSLAIILG